MSISEPAEQSPLTNIWIGHDGLRTGWAILLFFVVVVTTVTALSGIASSIQHPLTIRGRLTAPSVIMFEFAGCCGVLVATMVMSLIDKRSWLSYGLKAAHSLAHFGQGLFWGVVMMGIVIAALVSTHAVTIRFSGATSWSLIVSALLWMVAFFLLAIHEEMMFRGYLFFKLARSWSPITAAAVMSLLFGFAHVANYGETIAGILFVVALGLVCCLAVWRTGSLWWALGLHMAWDWSETFLFGAADSGLPATGRLLISRASGPTWLSGGSVGPEGSMVTFLALAILLLVVVLTLPHHRSNSR